MSGMDMQETQEAVNSLKHFNGRAKKEIKALQKQLKKIKKSSITKESHKAELLLRRRETIEKLRISNQEHDVLSEKVLRLRKELRNENHAKLVTSCQEMVIQYVKEIKREMEEGAGPGAASSTYHETKKDRQVPIIDEADSAFHQVENQLKLGDVMLDGARFGHDHGSTRHTFSSHQRGSELTGLSSTNSNDTSSTMMETKSDTPDGGGDSNPQSGGSNSTSKGEKEFELELSAQDRWLKSRKHQLMELHNEKKFPEGSKKKKGTGATSYSVKVLYEEREGLEYKCQLAVLRGFTFHELVEEACAHWGLSATYTFLEDPETGAIWPSSALVESELPLESTTPLLKLVFREHLSIGELIASTHGHGDVDTTEVKTSVDNAIQIGGDGDGGGKLHVFEDDWDAVMNDVHNPSTFHPHRLEKHFNDHTKNDHRHATVDSKYYVFRNSWVVRDFIIFLTFFIILNIYLTSKRNVFDAYWLNQAFEKPLQQRSFVSARTDYVPKLNEYGAVPTEVETTTYFDDATKSGSNNRYDSYRWWQQLNYFDIADASQWWMWVEGPLVDLIYGPMNSTSKHEPGYLREGTAQLLGKLRFRQLRVKANRGCTVSYLAKSLYSECYADFESQRQDTSVFTLSPDTTGFTWSSGGGKGKSTNLNGVWSTYPGDGFIVDFDYIDDNRNTFLSEIKRLRLDNWLDLKTRAVIVELTAFSSTHNLYLSSHMILEQSSSGLWTTSSQTWTSKLDVCYGCDATIVIDVLLYILMTWIVFTELLQLTNHCQNRNGLKSYCCSIWSFQQNLSIFFLICGIITRSIYISSSPAVLNALWTASPQAPGATRSYYDLTEHMRLIDAATTLESLAVLVVSFRFFMYMKKHPRMSQFTHVFVIAGTEIVFFSFMFAFTFFGFVLLGHNIYGAHLIAWSTIIKTTSTLIKMMVGNFDYEAMRRVDPVWTPFFFFFYIVFVFMILVNVFLAILNTSYTNVREEVSAEKKRLIRTKELRPKIGSKTSQMKQVYEFLTKNVLSKKAISSNGIYRRPEIVKKETEEKEHRETMSSNPWIST